LKTKKAESKLGSAFSLLIPSDILNKRDLKLKMRLAKKTRVKMANIDDSDVF